MGLTSYHPHNNIPLPHLADKHKRPKDDARPVQSHRMGRAREWDPIPPYSDSKKTRQTGSKGDSEGPMNPDTWMD